MAGIPLRMSKYLMLNDCGKLHVIICIISSKGEVRNFSCLVQNEFLAEAPRDQVQFWRGWSANDARKMGGDFGQSKP
jgi:hypothetical protein